MQSALLVQLAKSLGKRQASLELRWMRRAIDSSHSGIPLDEMVSRRATGEPLQYILGTQPFGPLNLLTRPPVLIPRPETEHWALMFADRVAAMAADTPSHRRLKLLDLGTGTGCLPLLLAHTVPQGKLDTHAVDISQHALRLANENAALCGIPSQSASKNTFRTYLADFLANDFPGPSLASALPIDVLVSNPPYIPDNEKLPESVLNYEDPKALFGGPSGLDYYHGIARLLMRPGLFSTNAVVALEVGHKQADIVEALLRDTGRKTTVCLDPWGVKRAVIGYM
ncbi:S-adenosyl-L-methionine-dependent methyltransferase [Coprinopsis marcescibilis]|uniref:S-adenosyl-L-methionine-dependent methyltransferase n=1 Tax=Coprinopsis marcescibilis TaxID=230819 RepID=A0A5C3KWW9_COPMA|nr:S-adenosyl-L-methionine-dependent methyltransferase [Coprinopsis marcescibilis]